MKEVYVDVSGRHGNIRCAFAIIVINDGMVENIKVGMVPGDNREAEEWVASYARQLWPGLTVYSDSVKPHPPKRSVGHMLAHYASRDKFQRTELNALR